MKLFALVGLALAATSSAAVAQDVEAGKDVFKKCFPCHSVGEGAKNKVGPILNGLDGRKAGTVPTYPYSEANKTSGLTWDEKTFKDYIKHPMQTIPKTKMTFAGIEKEKDIDNLWAYLKQFGPDGKIKAPDAKPGDTAKPEPAK